MPSDDYAVVSGGGALKLKGAKIGKKKKKKSAKTDLEKNLATGDESSVALVKRDTLADGHDDNGDYDDASASALKKRKKSPNREASGEDAQDDDDDDNERLPMVQKTEAERRHEEVRRKRVRIYSFFALNFFFIEPVHGSAMRHLTNIPFLFLAP